jgi:hypothetical protein
MSDAAIELNKGDANDHDHQDGTTEGPRHTGPIPDRESFQHMQALGAPGPPNLAPAAARPKTADAMITPSTCT